MQCLPVALAVPPSPSPVCTACPLLCPLYAWGPPGQAGWGRTAAWHNGGDLAEARVRAECLFHPLPARAGVTRYVRSPWGGVSVGTSVGPVAGPGVLLGVGHEPCVCGWRRSCEAFTSASARWGYEQVVVSISAERSQQH